MLGPDEPRYAAVGQEIARSGDWVTPHLWGEKWFEKPALLYWMTAIGFKLGLGPDLAPRLPVALLSIAFLVFLFYELKAHLDELAAAYAVGMLATSAGWLAYSHAAVTDIPMSVFFAAAMLLAFRGGMQRAVLAGACLGLAVLAKGLVPLVLAAPLVLRKRRFFDLVVVAAVCVAVAAPWYWLCYQRNGAEFVNEFIWKHHFQRFASPELQHVQPWWYYVPVLLAALFPWTPVLFTMPASKDRSGFRLFLIAWTIMGFLFFSASTNKLPGYLLPVLPALCILLAMRLVELKNARWVLAACGLLLAAIPFVADMLPVALVSGLGRTPVPSRDWFFVIPALLLAAQTWKLEAVAKRQQAVQVLVLAAGLAALFIKIATFPRMDALASARNIWRRVADRPVCVEDINRSWLYGLNYYAGKQLPKCEPNMPGAHLVPGTTSRPVIVDRVVLP